MEPVETKYKYIPTRYETFDNFDFNLSLNFADYLFIALYCSMIFHLSLIGKLLILPFKAILGNLPEREKDSQQHIGFKQEACTHLQIILMVSIKKQ